ncbi:MAG: glycoside hydrolase family 13 protein [Cyanothece sp. SIO1E1]|nr:glycoside hydrolase family 13 protein [Cyanothece sp. SIO1E1]
MKPFTSSIALLCLSLLFAIPVFGQEQINRVEPPFWWAGMKNSKLQLLIHGDNIAQLTPKIQYKGLSLERVIKVKSPNYLFLDLKMDAGIAPGTCNIVFLNASQEVSASYNYEFLAREKGSAQREGFNNSDVLYLITPDRFVNADPSNDSMEGLKEKSNRGFKGGRHGGDIKGIEQSLDYIADLGFTAIWVNPVLENDQEEYSYHGYSTTDFYKVDPRFGSNEEYRALSKKAKEKGVKFIMDMIVNHCGSGHWWMDDLPTEDWLNSTGDYVQTNHKKSVIQDPHGAEIDRKTFVDGWFVSTMPDLNQRNDLMATYLTQNSIWWIEYADLAGIRMDTYPYPDMNYMTEWTKAVMHEYPDFNVVGEEWNGNPAIVSYWQRGKQNPNGYTSELRSLMDFPVQENLVKALNVGSWNPVYEMLANDFLYPDPDNLVVFPDNHDMNRFYAAIGEDYAKFKLGLAMILTTRGIPQIYYGTEILMSNPGKGDHGIIRSDFPGGWAGDQVDAFSGAGLSSQQKEAKEFLKKILRWRKGAKALHNGKLLHYVPEHNTYVYFRYNATDKVMVVLNMGSEAATLDLDRFSEALPAQSTGKDVISGTAYKLAGTMVVPAMTPMVIELD